MQKQKALTVLRDYIIILIGSFMYAFAFDWLFVPNNIAMGGGTGIAQIINFFLPRLPIGVIVIIINIPLFIIGIRLKGIKILLSSAFAMLTSSVFIDIIPTVIQFKPMDDKVVACVLGGGIIGFALGIQLYAGATTGGTELAAALLKYKFKHIPIGRLCLFIDIAVIAVYCIVFRALNESLYAGIAMYISSIAMDSFIYGRNTAKVACIICSNPDRMIQELLGLNLGITKIKAQGGFSNNSKSVLICAFKPHKISLLKKAVVSADSSAFVIVCEAQDVFGEGFAECELDSL